MTTDTCRGERLLKVERGTASPNDELLVAAHLESCEDCQLLSALRSDLERSGDAQNQDGVLLRRMVQVGQSWARTGHAPRRRWRFGRPSKTKILLVALSVSVAAAASTLVAQRLIDSERPTMVVAVPAPAAKTHPELRPAMVRSFTELSSPSPTPPKSSSTEDSPPRTTAAEPPTALGLFQAASQARRAGQRSEAVQLYRRLESAFPTSREAVLAAVPLGGLLLESGDARGALGQFDRYLQSPSGGNLAAEALYGRGRAAAALGRKAEERHTWERLLQEFPRSPYESHARRRLSAID